MRLSKTNRFAGSEVARNIVGQPRSTIDPQGWLLEGKLVIVDTAKSEVGENAAALIGGALIGGALINLAALAAIEQGTRPPHARRAVTLLVDEAQTMPGADYETIVGELAKYGANLLLSTQSLARLDVLDRDQGRALRPTVFANVDGLFTFQVSADDAEYLAKELGGDLTAQDLQELGAYRCYARLFDEGERLPAFTVHLDPPPTSDPVRGEQLRALSAQRHGRHRDAVEADLRWTLRQIEEAGMAAAPPPKARNEHRPPKRTKRDPEQQSLFDQAGAAGAADGATEGEPSGGAADGGHELEGAPSDEADTAA